MSFQQRLDRHRESVPNEEAEALSDPATSESKVEIIYSRESSYTGHGPGERSFGLILTVAFHVTVFGAFLINWGVSYVQQEVPTLTVFDVGKPAAPPEPETEIPPGPEQIKKEKPLPEPARPKIEPPEIRISRSTPITLPDIKPVPDPGPPVERTTAPESKPAPPAPQVSDAKPTWQGQVLAALNKAKRYPREASFRRQQGVPWIRFVIDREGRVLSTTLERSSGVRSLDEEALRLPKRAQPLPKPPTDVPGDTIELVVPVEFFMS
ncbi:TonB family protein [Croceicoccus estronivorus]|uniref:TonB family protein n=1 Tax=Croceicoccus estronivorus TaxID=1172626 RepID=UPI0009EEF279|nr:TonB family protein [Croceicoccus estronivorus]